MLYSSQSAIKVSKRLKELLSSSLNLPKTKFPSYCPSNILQEKLSNICTTGIDLSFNGRII